MLISIKVKGHLGDGRTVLPGKVPLGTLGWWGGDLGDGRVVIPRKMGEVGFTRKSVLWNNQ